MTCKYTVLSYSGNTYEIYGKEDWTIGEIKQVAEARLAVSIRDVIQQVIPINTRTGRPKKVNR